MLKRVTGGLSYCTGGGGRGRACSTDTETTQEAPAARLPPAREIVVVPPSAVSVPSQVFEVTAGVVIRNPGAGVLGKMSMKLRPVMGTVAVFVIVKTTVTTLPFVVELGTNCLVNPGGVARITKRSTGALGTGGAWLLVRVTAGLV